MKETQTTKILAHLKKYESITPLDALREYGCMRLASRINDLKNMGYCITKKMESYKNRDGETVRYARYFYGDEEV